uniref:Uncharacterized protein n=1 Tax=Panagrolaimus superbus TaxID=310955 RepID=A0A914ZEN8_9BILA
MSRNIIATCGGMKDGTIKFWNLSTGELVTNVVAASKQTSAIVFDQHYGEMATTHGGNKNCINVWKYSAASSKFSLAHEIKCINRPINMVKSACDGFVLVTNAAQQLEFFDLFKKDEEESLRKKHFGFNGIR